jgi:myo-inositol-1(or 4)-monophosphatase
LQQNPLSTSGSERTIDELLEIAVDAATDAARVIQASIGRRDTLVWEEKSSADFVTQVDRDAEAAITRIVRSRCAEAYIIGEELTPDGKPGQGISFIVDPLDGTTNFLHGYPEFAVSIGVMIGLELVAGVVRNLTREETFTATRGGGAFVNGVAISVSRETDPSRALIGTGFPFKRHDLLPEYAAQFVEVSRYTAGIRRAGSAALDLSNLACGRFDGFWELVLAPWDISAGILLVREAGGIVTDLAGEKKTISQGSVVAGNPDIHPWLLRTVGDATRAQTS